MVILKNLEKSFGPLPVLKNVSFAVNKGECYCLIGKNGAGKSTIINILIDVLSADKGSIELFGTNYDDDPTLIKKNIGVLPEFNPVIEDFSGLEYLKYIGSIYNLPSKVITDRSNLLLEYFFDDFEQIQKKIGHYSKGMKIKIGLCAAVIHKPKFLILDEPFENLDPLVRNNLSNFLNGYREKGNAILVSSHELVCVENIATHLGILKNGSLIYSGCRDEFTNKEEDFNQAISKILGFDSKSFEQFWDS
jgi:ABC-2 type transport system ATP-binding protein